MSLFSEITYGLIGYPLSHSISPLLHNSALKQLSLPGRYKLFPEKPEQIDNFLVNLKNHKNLRGLNVTVPYKEKVLNFLDFQSEDVGKAGACNTIVNEDSSLKGFNTDLGGFLKHLKELFDPLGKRVALLGAGGAARAVSYALIKENVAELAIYDIDIKKSKKLAEDIINLSGLPENISIDWVESLDLLKTNGKDLLINATPVGLKSKDEPVIDKSFLHKELFVYDLIYNPGETKLLAAAKKIGANNSNGLGMLIYQAAESFIYFTRADNPIEEIAEIMKQAAKEKVV